MQTGTPYVCRVLDSHFCIGTFLCSISLDFKNISKNVLGVRNTKELVTDNRLEGNSTQSSFELWMNISCPFHIRLSFCDVGTLSLFTSIQPGVKTQSSLFLFCFLFFLVWGPWGFCRTQLFTQTSRIRAHDYS